MNKELFELISSFSEKDYKKFSSSLIPNVDKEFILGVRMPILRKIAKTLSFSQFINSDFKYQEEKLLYVFTINEIKDYDKCIELVDGFLEYIDNWAVCDSLRPKAFKNNKDCLIVKIFEWLKSSEPYTLRFAIEMLMVYYLDNDFKEEYLVIVSEIKSKDYYVNMMIAWYFSTALYKKYSQTIKFFESRILDDWTHNKAIQKALESYRITNEQKEYLKTLKRKTI